jgi:histidinol-phosphate aminotransferase
VDALGAEFRSIQLHRYPDREALALREAIAAHHGVRPDQVFCANGSNEVIQCLLLAYGGPQRPVMVFTPTYELHSHIAKITGTPVIAGKRNDDFEVEPAEIARVVDVCSSRYGRRAPVVSFLCSPNNPTGGVETLDSLAAVAQMVPGLLLVDEAYGQFASSSAIELIASQPRLVVLRTFSKTWALAGLRLGYAIAHPRVIASMSNVALPYHLDAFKQAAGRLALGFDAEMSERVAAIVKERERLQRALSSLPVQSWPSQANFILFRPLSARGSEVWQALLERDVLIRDFSGSPGLDNCLRVTIGTPSENDRFLACLPEVLSGPAL